MATIKERLALLITADVDGAVKELDKLGDSAERDIGRATSKADMLGSRLTKVGAGMLSVGAAGAVGLVKAAGAASDLNEAINVTGLVFGDAAGQLDEFHASAAEALGQSERAAREATATFGGLLDNLGFAQDETVQWSMDLTTLASDLGSAFNTDPADAVLALGSALRGEQEPIRRYNVMLDDASVRARAVEMGLAATTNEVDNNAKVQARLNIIMEQTSKVQGDFANTSDGFANSQRRLAAQFENFQAQLGQGMLPVLEKLMGFSNDLLGWFNALDPATKETIALAATLTTGFALFGGALSLAAGQVIKFRNNLPGLTKALGKTPGGLAGALAIATAALLVFNKVKQIGEDRAANVAASTEAYAAALLEGRSETEAAAAAVEKLTEQFPRVSKAMDEAGVSAEDVAAALLAGGPEWEAMTDTLGKASVLAGDLNFQLLDDDLEDLAKGFAAANDSGVEFAATGRELTGGHWSHIASIRTLQDELSNTADETDELNQSWDELVQSLLGGLDVESQTRQLLDDIAVAVGEVNDKTLAEIQAQVFNFTSELAALMEQGDATNEELDLLFEAAQLGLLALTDQGGLATDEVQQLLDTLKVLDGLRVDAEISIRGLSQADRNFLMGFAPQATVGAAAPQTTSITVELDGDAVAQAVARREGQGVFG